MVLLVQLATSYFGDGEVFLQPGRAGVVPLCNRFKQCELARRTQRKIKCGIR